MVPWDEALADALLDGQCFTRGAVAAPGPTFVELELGRSPRRVEQNGCNQLAPTLELALVAE